MNKEEIEIKLSEEMLIEMIRGKKLVRIQSNRRITILPPLYDDSDRFKYAFEAGKQFQRDAEMFLSPDKPTS